MYYFKAVRKYYPSGHWGSWAAGDDASVYYYLGKRTLPPRFLDVHGYGLMAFKTLDRVVSFIGMHSTKWDAPGIAIGTCEPGCHTPLSDMGMMTTHQIRMLRWDGILPPWDLLVPFPAGTVVLRDFTPKVIISGDELCALAGWE